MANTSGGGVVVEGVGMIDGLIPAAEPPLF
jgi:hypothetical protein